MGSVDTVKRIRGVGQIADGCNVMYSKAVYATERRIVDFMISSSRQWSILELYREEREGKERMVKWSTLLRYFLIYLYSYAGQVDT